MLQNQDTLQIIMLEERERGGERERERGSVHIHENIQVYMH